jgi:hypothetical protein
VISGVSPQHQKRKIISGVDSAKSIFFGVDGEGRGGRSKVYQNVKVAADGPSGDPELSPANVSNTG